MFLLRKRFWLTVGKLLAMAFPVALVAAQVPELRYDLGSSTPVQVASPAELQPAAFGRATFVALAGKVRLDRAFVYKTHGLAYTYLLLEPYGRRVVVRTAGPVSDEWKRFDRFLGKLRPIGRLPFRRTVLGTFQQRFGETIPADAYFLAHEDVPAVSGWNVAAVIFSLLLWAGMLYGFFLWPRRKSPLTALPRPSKYG